MAKQPPARRILKWVGFLICLMLLALHFLSWVVGVAWISKDKHHILQVVDSAAWSIRVGPDPEHYSRMSSGYEPGWHVWIAAKKPRPLWHPDFYSPVMNRIEGVPFLPYAILAALFAVILLGWSMWLDHRRIPPGHCQSCGYNLTGNESGICPECGKPIPSSDREKVCEP